jgi:Tol biopolymer transport system component
MGAIRAHALSAVAVFSLIAATDAGAQYFGRNKVEYTDFDFRILKTEHFDVYHYRREERAARIAAQLAERWYSRFSKALHHDLATRQPIVLYGSQPEFAQTNVVTGLLSDTIGGVTESSKRRIVMPFAPTLGETNRVLGHEIAHAFQFDIGRRYRSGWSQPLWFIEGMAEYLARGGTDAEAALWLRDAASSGRLPQRQRDAARQLSPYQYGHAFWAYLAERFGDDVIERALKPPKGGKFKDRMRYATGKDLDELYAEWLAAVREGRPRQADARQASPFFANDVSGRLQLGPSVSPDGRYAVFFSERDRLALDLFLADVNTGQIVRKLATTTASARFDSLQPLRSAGAWSSDGERFAFPAVREGRASLMLLDMSRSGRDDEIPFATLGQILSVTWSPDGKSLALSALAGGFTDLYLYDLHSSSLRQLTDDAYAELHPAWSPDGRAIAFATDRFSSDLAALRFGRSGLAILDPQSGAVREISVASRSAAYINPQWSTDGQQLYCVADPDGVSNIFRFDLATGAVNQLTDVTTGVGGLTGTSPALSVASHAPVVAYTIYGNRKHQLVILKGAAATAGWSVERSATLAAQSLESGSPSSGGATQSSATADSEASTPAPEQMEIQEYSSRLALERIGQPYVTSGGGALGTFVRGGGSLLFGDMLGERKLGAAVQIGNHMRDAAFEVRFLNREQRWNWGAVAQLEPAVRRYRFTQTVEHDGESAIMQQADYLQRVQLHVAGLLAYPVNRAVRVEFITGVRHAAYRRDTRSQVSSVATGRVLERGSEESSGGDPTTVAEFGTALVRDTSVFGPTGPVLGSRYRLELAPAVGDLTYTRLLMDYRQYLMPVRPYTLAMRLIHQGRYGPDGNDLRLLPGFLGSSYFVRGHTSDARDCQPNPDRGCGDELLGSRQLVGNIELRVPVWGLLSRQLQYGPLPMEAFAFADGGVVWSKSQIEAIGTTRRHTISSIGVGVRMNAGGLPFEFAALRALDGPAPGWSLDFGFRTGF